MIHISLFEQVLGTKYLELPACVQRFHRLTGRTVLYGWVETSAPESPMARCLAFFLGSPRSASSGPIRFELESGPVVETWTRHFPTRTMTSHMRLVAGRIEERLGAARLTFNLTVVEGKLNMQLEKMKFFGVACPNWLLPKIVAQETGFDNQLHFNISATLPVAGTVARYRGHLEVCPKELS